MDVPDRPDLIAAIEAFCLRHEMADSRFGREATGEPQLLLSLRRNRDPGLELVNRIADFMKRRDAEAGFGADHVAAGSGSAAAPSPDTSLENIGVPA